MLAEELIDLLIRSEAQRSRQTVQGDDALQGLYISEQELDALLFTFLRYFPPEDVAALRAGREPSAGTGEASSYTASAIGWDVARA